MSTDRDDDRWGNDGDDRKAPMDSEAFRRAKGRVGLPAKLLIAGAGIMILLAVANIAMVVSGYDLTLKWLELIEKQQPPGQARDDFKKEVEKARVRDRTPEYIQNAVGSALGLTLDFLILIGGLKMHGLRGRSLAIAGAICAVIPVNSCCCIGIPLGIWALVVLFDPNVKAAFEAVKSGVDPTPPNDDFR